MIHEAFGVGNTIEIAQNKAREALGVDDSVDVSFDVIDFPVKKTFGLFGGVPAKVRAYYEVSPAKKAEAYLKDILTKMGANELSVVTEEVEGGAIFNISGADVGMIIGRRGETLDSLQYLTGLVANQAQSSYYRVTINTGNYREKREKTLESLASRMASKAIKTGRNQFLEPMNPYERRIIHTTVQGIEGVRSWSEGDSVRRHVVIGPEGGQTKPPYRNNKNSNYKPRYQNGNKNYVKKDNRTESKPQNNEVKKTVKTESNDNSFYGKIQ